MDYQEFRDKLFENAEEGYRDFVLGGIITERPLLGVRIPKCRELAKEVLSGKFSGNLAGMALTGEDELLRNAREFLKNEPVSFEEVMVRGLIIAELPYEKMVSEIYDFIALVDNWEISDCFCAAMKKNIKAHRADFLEEVDKMLRSLDEFQTRVGIVCLLDHYLEADYLAVIFDRVNEMAEFLGEGPGVLSVERMPGERMGKRVHEKVLSWDAYYVKVAVAWLLATCFAKFSEETMAFFKQVRLPRWTFNKTIAKACESYRVDKEVKGELRGLKNTREKTW